jgi:endonuclease/exonuclease/phosphatase family metal-dependent hydrolase
MNNTIRLMTYNVRRCQGLDTKTAPERIASIINRYKPDVLALQEVDVNRQRTGRVDQPKLIGELTGMNSYFYARLKQKEEKYGIAFLSHHPMELIKAGDLPSVYPSDETTGAVWMKVRIGNSDLNVFITHFKHNLEERKIQAEALMGPEWLDHGKSLKNIVLMGDFNSRWISAVYHSFEKNLIDAQLSPSRPNKKIIKTWPSFFPVLRIDHLFLSREFTVQNIETARDLNAKIASDHLPLIADVELKAS